MEYPKFRFVDKFLNFLDWYRIEDIENYYLIGHNQVMVAEMWRGRSGWIAIIYDGPTYFEESLDTIEHLIAGYILNKNN